MNRGLKAAIFVSLLITYFCCQEYIKNLMKSGEPTPSGFFSELWGWIIFVAAWSVVELFTLVWQQMREAITRRQRVRNVPIGYLCLWLMEMFAIAWFGISIATAAFMEVSTALMAAVASIILVTGIALIPSKGKAA